jgi:hypothetical protein
MQWLPYFVALRNVPSDGQKTYRMIKLEQKDLRQLQEILQRLPEFEDEKSRRRLLPLLGLALFLPRLDLSGSPSVAGSGLIDFLVKYGRLSDGIEALEYLVSGLKEYVGIADQEVLNAILQKYQLLSPGNHFNVDTGRLDTHQINQVGGFSSEGVLSDGQTGSAHNRVEQVIIIYSHEDEQWLQMLKTHLALLEYQQLIRIWDDTMISVGKKRKQASYDELNAARIVIALISASFFASQSIIEQELPHILRRVAQEQLWLLPLVLSPCLYEASPLRSYQTFNPVNQPLSGLLPSQVDGVFVNLARTIHQKLQ